MAKELHLEVANFHCRFGERYEMLDFAEGVIGPAFLEARERKYGDTNYFFFDQTVVQIQRDGPVIGIAGRFIKNTVLTRSQYFSERRGLIQDERKLRSAPSALFVLLLHNHRLLFLPETSYPPTLKNFQATAARFLTEAHDSFIRKTREERADQQPAPSLKRLREEFPPPVLEVVPVAGERELRDFIDLYDVLLSSEVALVETNNEIDNDEFFQSMRKSKNATGAKSTKFIHSNPGGLDQDAVYGLVDTAAQQGNSRIKLTGRDTSGDKLVGSNESFRIRIPIREVSEEVQRAARSMYQAYRRTLDAGSIRESTTAQVTWRRLANLLSRLRGHRRE